MRQRQRGLLTFLRTYGEDVPGPQFKDILSRPGGLGDIPEQTRAALSECIILAIRKGLAALVPKDLALNAYVPFSDAVASQVVGKVDTRVQLVAKVGDLGLKQQMDFMADQKRRYPQLYPEVFGSVRRHGVYTYVMEHLGDYVSLHDLVFCTMHTRPQIVSAIDSLFGVMARVYRNEMKRYTAPNLSRLYTQGRIRARIKEARANPRLSAGFLARFRRILPRGLDSLLESEIQLAGLPLSSFDTCIKRAEARLHALGPNFSTTIHGDLHPGNVMLRPAKGKYDVRLIDPNPHISPSDYVYDMGKLVHWLEMTGWLILERRTRRRLVKVDLSGASPHLRGKVTIGGENIRLNGNTMSQARIQLQQGWALKHTLGCIDDLARAFKDHHYQDRLRLATASAYLGGITRFRDDSHQIAVFLQGLKHLNALKS